MYNDSVQRSGYEKGGYQETNEYQTNGSFNKNGNGNNNYNGNNFRNKFNNQSENRSYSPKRFQYNPIRNNPQAPRNFDMDPPIFYKPYFGTGNKEAPETALKELSDIKDFLSSKDYTVRTSAFDGPDQVFMTGKFKEIILPWKGFGGSDSKLTFNSEESKFFARQFFPNYDGLNDQIKAFLAKNVRLVCGQNLKSISQFGVIWSEDGAETPNECTNRTGNIRHVILIANELRVPIFNIAKPNAKERLIQRFNLNN